MSSDPATVAAEPGGAARRLELAAAVLAGDQGRRTFSAPPPGRRGLHREPARLLAGDAPLRPVFGHGRAPWLQEGSDEQAVAVRAVLATHERIIEAVPQLAADQPLSLLGRDGRRRIEDPQLALLGQAAVELCSPVAWGEQRVDGGEHGVTLWRDCDN